jgi:hypothetical protein
MMKKTLRHLLLILVSLDLFLVNAIAGSPEEAYLETRDNFIRQFARNEAPGNGDHDHALRVLEELLWKAVGTVRVPGFSGRGTISLESLVPRGGGFNQVDGLMFDAARKRLFVTTRVLLKHYVERNKDLPQGYLHLAESEEFYSRVFDWDSAFTRFSEIPVRIIGDFSVARAFLTLNAQDIGPFVPKTIIVFAVKGNRVFLIRSDASVGQIAACKSQWDIFESRSLEAFRRYRSSQLTDRKAINESSKIEEEGFRAYRSCFGNSIKGQKAFLQMEDQVQAIIDRLQNVTAK